MLAKFFMEDIYQSHANNFHFFPHVHNSWFKLVRCALNLHSHHILSSNKILQTRMHSSGMRIACLLTVSQHALGRVGVYPRMHWPGGSVCLGVSAWGVSTGGGVCPRGCLPGGVCPGGGVCLGGVSTQKCVADTPRTDLWKHNLRKLRLRAVKSWYTTEPRNYKTFCKHLLLLRKLLINQVAKKKERKKYLSNIEHFCSQRHGNKSLESMTLLQLCHHVTSVAVLCTEKFTFSTRWPPNVLNLDSKNI